jgi:hypothetical protein
LKESHRQGPPGPEGLPGKNEKKPILLLSGNYFFCELSKKKREKLRFSGFKAKKFNKCRCCLINAWALYYITYSSRLS